METRTWPVILPRNILGVESEFSLGHGLFATLVLRSYMVFLRLYITPNKPSYARISCWCFQVQENFFHRNERDNNIQPFKFGGHQSGNVQFGELIHVISVIKVSKFSILSVFGRYSPCNCFWKINIWFPFVKFFCKTSNISTYLESRGSNCWSRKSH